MTGVVSACRPSYAFCQQTRTPCATRRRVSRPFSVRSCGSRPISRVLSWTAIHLGRRSPAASCGLPAGFDGPSMSRGRACLFGLAPGGVCPPEPLPVRPCALTARFHPCLSQPDVGHRRYVSVALSVALGPCGLAAPRRYLAPCPVEPGLSSAHYAQRLSGRLPAKNIGIGKAKDKRCRQTADFVAPGSGERKVCNVVSVQGVASH